MWILLEHDSSLQGVYSSLYLKSNTVEANEYTNSSNCFVVLMSMKLHFLAGSTSGAAADLAGNAPSHLEMTSFRHSMELFLPCKRK
jgi:hypothetical protein